MAKVKNGDSVKVHYTGKLEDGTVFDTSVNRDPIQFTMGDGQIIPGFEEALLGMSPGESKTFEVTADKAYGPHRKEMVMVVSPSQFPSDLEPAIGQQLQVRQQGDERVMLVTVIDISESGVTLDANHPLAGKDLTFDVQLVEVV